MDEHSPALEKLSALVGVRRGEWRQAWPALAFAFAAVGVTSLSTIATDTLFVSRFPLGEVSRFYVVSSVVRVAMAFGYAELTRRFAGHRRDASVLAACALSMIGSAALAHTGSAAAVYAACLAQLVLPPFLPLIAFNAAMSCFQVRQAKRLLPLVAAASTVGTIAVAAGARVVAPLVGTPNLLNVGAALALVAAPLPGLLAQRARAAGVDEARGAPKPKDDGAGVLATFVDTARDVRGVPVVRIVVVYSVLGAALTAFVDFAFKAALKVRFGRDEMAAYLGAFGAITNVAVLFVQLFLTSRLVSRFGMRAALQLFPGTLAAIAPAVLAAPGVASVSAAKLADTVLRFSLGGSVADMLLTPAPTDVRTRAKVMVKGLATPFGGLVAGGVLLAFGRDGPGLRWCAVLIAATGVAAVLLTLGARRAYAAALSRALGEGRLGLDLTPAQADLLRGELAPVLARAAEAGDVHAAQRALAVMTDRVFTMKDVAQALRADSAAIRQAGAETAARLAKPGEGDALLALVPADSDDEVELRVLRTARALGATVPRARVARVLDLPPPSDGPALDLWTEALLALAQHPEERDLAVKKLRKAALEDDSPRRAAAVRALGDLRERRAEREIMRALASDDAQVFGEAARAAVLVEAPGIVASLTMRLGTGPHVRATARALALAGPAAVGELIAMLPTTRGEGAVAPTAVASGRVVAGNVRAARVLARLGPEACLRVLDRFSDLGYRGRNAVARALATVPEATGRALDEARVMRATEIILTYAESLVTGFRALPPGLLREEVLHRIGETAVRVLDLSSAIREREAIERARAALARHENARGHALELLENVLPPALARRTVGLLEMDLDGDGTGGDALLAVRPGLGAMAPGASLPPPPSSARPASTPPPRSIPSAARRGSIDGWLEKCRQFDDGDPALDAPTRELLEKVLVLRRSSLFLGLSGEELYPVAEIATAIGFGPREIVIREGEPGDALFVVGEGSLGIVRGEVKVRELGPGSAFGEMALLDGAPRAATVVATTGARLLRIPREEFEHLFDEYPELARGVIRVLLGHLRAAA